MLAGLVVEAEVGVGDGPEDDGAAGSVRVTEVPLASSSWKWKRTSAAVGGVHEAVVAPGGEGGDEAVGVAAAGRGVVDDVDVFGVEELWWDGAGGLDEGLEGGAEGVAAEKLAGAGLTGDGDQGADLVGEDLDGLGEGDLAFGDVGAAAGEDGEGVDGAGRVGVRGDPGW